MTEEEWTESMVQMIRSSSIKRLENSWSVIDKKERKRRLAYVIKLSAELHRIKEISPQGTRLAEGIIEDIIVGDLYCVLDTAEGFVDGHYGADAELWATFVSLVKDAHLVLTTKVEA